MANPWRDRTYLAYVATEAVLFLDDAMFKVGLPLRIAHASNAPHGLAPLLMVLNNVMVVALQIPLARFGTTTAAAFTTAEMLHATVSWELSVALALALALALDTGPAGWLTFGTLIALTCAVQHQLVRVRLGTPPLSVPPITVSEH